MYKLLLFIAVLCISNFVTYHLSQNSSRNSDHDTNGSRSIDFNTPEEVMLPSINRVEVEHIEQLPVEVAAYPEMKDLSGVGQVLLAVDDFALREQLLRVFTAHWFFEDHRGLGEWLNELPPEVDVDSSLAIFAKLASEIDPEGAVEWAASISDSDLREKILVQSARQFETFDPIRFQDFLRSESYSASAVRGTRIFRSNQEMASAEKERYDIVEDEPESIERILARRTRLPSSSSRVNRVELAAE
ncbi:MAG: hypothetical protein AAF065_00110 [Verrucomicrobiota bacterium]